MHILLVEDEDAHAELIRRAFEDQDEKVSLTVARNLREAENLLTTLTPDLVLTDLLLPDGHGIELLPPDQETATYPVVVMTSHGDQQIAVEALKSGALDYIVKSEVTLTDMPHLVRRAQREWSHIVQRRHAEAALRKSEANLKRAQKLARLGSWEWEPKTDKVVCSEELYNIFGIGPKNTGDTLQAIIEDIVHPEDRPKVREMVSKIWPPGLGRAVEYRIIRSDGEIRWIRALGECIFEGDVLTKVIGTNQDVTEQKQAEEALRQERNFSEAVLDSLPGIFFMLDDQARLLRWNKRSEEVGGYTTQEVIHMHPTDFFVGEDKTRIAAKLQQVFVEGKGDLEADYITKSGQKIPYYFAAWRTVLGDRTYVVGFGIDLTERQQLEAQLRQAKKMDAIGRLAGGIAHDFNNLLTVITGYTNLLLECHNDESDPEHFDLEQIKQAADRAISLTRQLLAFSRQQVLQTRVLNLNNIVTDLNKMLHRLIGEDIELVTRLEPELGRVKADPSQMEQVILNLVVNARDAMPQGGKLIIETANVYLDEAYARLYVEVVPGPFVMLTVTDTGIGMDKETQARIFEPFFTTKATGKGTGLGLATVHGIVKQSGGHIWVYSEPGQGTVFKIYLPQTPFQEPAHSELVRFQNGFGTETVLLVEDEEAVRGFAHRVLTTKGYTVLTAQNGPEAIEICKQYSDHIHLLLTDMIMPGGLNGPELAKSLSGMYPHLKVIYMSGYTDNTLIDRSLLTSEIVFLQKPFTPAGLVGKLREVLDKAVV